MSDLDTFLNMSEDDAINAMTKLRAKKTQSAFQGGTIFNPSKIRTNQSAQIRFLPNKDSTNEEFWAEKKVIPLKFVDPENPKHFIKLNIPSLEMYDATKQCCPLVNRVRALYKDAKALEKVGKTAEAERIAKLASQHWIDPEYIFQGFVPKPGYDEEPPENPIRRMFLKKTIFRIIDAGINNEDAEQRLPAWPCHPKLGYNFFIRKTIKKAPDGDQNSYETSGWAHSSSPLSDEQIEALRKWGLSDLHSFLPPRPTEDEFEFYGQLLDLSIAARGRADWNPDWESQLGQVKPFKVDDKGKMVREETEETTSRTSHQVRTPVVAEEEGDSAESVMSGIRRGAEAPEDTSEDATPEVEVVAAKPATGVPNPDVVKSIRARMAAKAAAAK